MSKEIFEAVVSGDAEKTIKSLVGRKINTVSYYGAMCIIKAVKLGNVEILKALLEKSKNAPRSSFWKSCYGVSRNCWREAGNNEEIIKLLIEYGAEKHRK